MYFLYKEIFQSVVALNYTKLLDPNSGYGLQFLIVISIFLYFSNKAQSIHQNFFNFILFIVFMSLYIGILQTVIYQPEASIANIDNLSIFNPLDLSTLEALFKLSQFSGLYPMQLMQKLKMFRLI